MKSEYRHLFFFRVTEAARTGWACLMIGAVLLYVPNLSVVASVPVLAPVLAVLVAGPPLATVLQTSVGILTVALPALASTMAVLQVLKPPISKFAAIACTGVSSLFIAYLSETHLLGRKTALAQVSIVYVTAHYTADMNVVTFPLKMIATDVLGVGFAIVATIFPIPRLAVFEVRESAKSAARGASHFFKTLVKAFSAPNASTFGSMHLHSNVLATAAAESLTDLEKKQVHIWWELGACGARHANERFTEGLTCLNLHLTGMEMALESGYVLYTPRSLRGPLQGTLMKVVDQCKSLLDVGVKGLPSLSSMDRISRYKLIEEGKETLNLFDMNYQAAREQAYYTAATESTSSDIEAEDVINEPWKDDTTGSNWHDLPLVRHKFRGRVSMLFFMFNLRLYFVEAINLVSAGHNSTTKMHQIARIGPSLAGLELSIHDHDGIKSEPEASPEENSSSENSKRSASEPAFLRPDDPTVDGIRRFSLGGLNRDSSSRQQSGHRSAVFTEDSRPRAQVPEADALQEDATEGTVKSRLASGRVKRSVRRQCNHRNAVAMEKVIKTVSDSDTDTWKLLRALGLKPSKTQMKRSFKTALAMILATIFGELALQGETQAYWAPVSVGFLIGNFQGGSWRMSSLRLQGTVLGAIYGFLALTASHNRRWAILLLLIPWVIFSSFIRYSAAYGYSGLVSAFTAAILMLGGFHDDIKQFAMTRITETFVGIFCFVFVESVIFPERAVVLVRQELVSSLVSLRDCVGAIVTVYTEQDCIYCRGLAVKEIKELEHALRASFAKQTVLSKEAALEPDLWFVPFAAAVYSKLIVIQGRMLNILYFMVCSLHATTEECLSEQMETLIKPLRASLSALQEEVLSTINSLQEALQVEIVHDGRLHRLKLWLKHCAGLNCSDVEQPQTSHPDPLHPLLVLGYRHRSVDGTPVNLKSTMDQFERSFEDVLEDLIATTKAEEEKKMVSNSVMLSVGALTFSLHALLRETVQLEKVIHELLQAESPWSVLDFWDTYSLGNGNMHVFSDPSLAAGQ